MTDAVKEMHPASRRRETLAALKRDHDHVPIRNGTEQADAIHTVRSEMKHLATVLETRCADGRSKQKALDALLEAQFWAMHAISHRE